MVVIFILLLVLPIFLPCASWGSDWPDWRGPARDGVSVETSLPTQWSPAGQNLAWKVPYGGRSAPIVLGDRLFLQNSVGEGETQQERVMCFHADTGKLLWEHRFNVFLSDVPPHHVGWASPVADPASGNVYAYGVGGTLLALSREGKLLWERFLSENFGVITTHGGRTVSPIIEGDLVIVSGVSSGWGKQARGRHRFMAFDKKTGETVWVRAPGGRPYDTTYSPPIAAVINGTRLLIAGGGDGAVHALKPQTGEPVWKFAMSKRGINTGVVIKDATAVVSHSEENPDSSEMGLIAAIDAAATGNLGKVHVRWAVRGFLAGFSSPVIDGDRVYQIDNSANLYAFEIASGKKLWTLNLGTIQRASPVLADGKLYVGTQNGKFYILRPGPDRCEILDADLLGSETAPEEIIGSAAVSRGRVYLVSSEALYCIGKKPKQASTRSSIPKATAAREPAAHVQVVPAEVVLQPGKSVRFRARLFDRHGRLIREGKAAWLLEQLPGKIQAGGTIQNGGRFLAASDPVAQAGQVKATVEGLSGIARVRVIPALPWDEDFQSLAVGRPPRHWIAATGKFVVREVDGNKVLVKLSDKPFLRRARVYMGPSNWSNYTIEVDVRATEKRRQIGDAGVVAQRYSLVLFGNRQRLELQSWQPETARTVSAAFPWNGDAWYRLKLRVENLPDGKVQVRGKAWPVGKAEPEPWLVERVDPIPNLQGSPGLYANAPVEVFFDNLKVRPNQSP